jgi:hypothetical protein
LFYVIIAVVSVIVMYAMLKLSLQKPNLTLQQFALMLALVLFLVALVFLVATGRLNWLVAVGAAILPFLKRLPLLLRMLPFAGVITRLIRSARSSAPRGSSGPAPGASSREKSSSIKTRFVVMILYHDSGQTNGEIQEGQFRGRYLTSMSLQELMLFRDECRVDGDSLRVLESWLDRNRETWREAADQARPTTGGSMNREEALDILGLTESADRQDIIDAHRKLIQKLHPDRGGSTYLAAKLNEAKDLLLG